MMFGPLAFLNPLLLLGLLSLPVIWWLLRFTPPRPQEVAFPPIRLLLELRSQEETPSRSPWWLTALRMLIAALIIFALASPVLNPRGEALIATRPLLIVVDNGWAAASRWPQRQEMIGSLIQRAESNGQTVTLVATAGGAAALAPEPLSPAKAREKAAGLQPQPYGAGRDALARALDAGLPQGRGFDVVWLSDGVEDGKSEALIAVLRRLAEGGELTVAADRAGSEPLGLAGQSNVEKGLVARITSPGSDAPRSGTVAALSGKGARLAEADFTIGAGEKAAEAKIDLPLELRNQVTRLEIDGETSAGAVALLDARSLWQRYGVISGEAREAAQPLLSPTHYIERALAPHGEVILSATGNVERGTEALLERNPSVLIMSDIGTLVGRTEARLTAWVEKGGMLIRFAGPRLEKSVDSLLPVQLREGGRTMGGALSWGTPQRLAAFEETSPYYGLSIPNDVLITRQVLADPTSQQNPATLIWARLEDGTPLVTATKLGDGHLVLFHITGNSDWSNLPMSGLFVEMLRRTGELSSLSTSPERGEVGAAAPAQKPADTALNPSRGLVLTPWRTLDGFGRMGPPPVTANALPAANPDAARPGPGLPPGFYGPPGRTRALNVMRPESNLTALAPAMAGGRVISFEAQKPLLLMPWLLLAAFALFAFDAMITLLLMSGGFFSRRAARAATAGLAGLMLLGLAFAPGASAPAYAQNQPSGADQDFALQASLTTRLAYVITGDASIDDVSRQGLIGLSRVLAARTAIEPGDPMGVNVDTDELVFFALIYWPVRPEAEPLSDATAAKIDAYMKQGGMIIFDTKDYQMPFGGTGSGQSPALTSLLGRLDIPRLEPVPEDHVLTKSFYLMRGFPGRWDGGTLWVEAQTTEENGETRRALKSDGVSSILITSNDFAGAWALDANGRPMFAAVPGGEVQREMAFRSGVNIVMYALTGNYKADQVHVPALLERLGQ